MKVSDFTIELDNDQINRCYDVFLFEEDEFIVSAYYYKDIDKLVINYKNNDIEEADLAYTSYEPDLSSKEGREKLHYILFGKGETLVC